MQQHFYRTLLIYAVLVVSAILIYPTIGWMTLSEEERQARLERWQEEDRAFEDRGFFGDMWHGIQRWAEFDRDQVINLGLDLQGGVHMVVGFDMTEEAEERELTEEQVQEIILQRVRNRINEFEAKEPIIQKLGNDQVQIQLPGEKDINRAKELIMRTAFLTFHIVAGPDETTQVFRAIDTEFDNTFIPFLEPPLNRGGPFQVPEENIERVRDVIQRARQVEGLIPEDKGIAFSPPPKPGDDRGYLIYLMNREPEMTGEDLQSAVARPDNQNPGYWQILFEFGPDGSRDFAAVTEANINRTMAIVLDDNVVSAPNISQRIFGSGQITGSFSAEEARDLAISLNSGSMPVPVHEDYTGVVGASLGADSVEKGITASLVGLVCVMLFMLFYYRVGGIVANIALIANGLIILGALAYFNATLTLPGIAGLILTIGMAVDANVLIFERIREELRNGKSLASSIEGGYDNATSAILDANVTTLIAAAVLTQFGTGPVQGFAVTLSIGVVASVFSALVITRAVLDFLSERKFISNLTMASIVKPETRISFIPKWRYAATLSAVVIVIGIAAFGIRGADNFGVDFTEGTNMTVALRSEEPIPVGQVRQVLEEAGFTAPTVQEYAGETIEDVGSEFVIRVGDVEMTGTDQQDSGVVSETVSSRIQQALLPLTTNPGGDPNEQVILEQVETVGPAVGQRLRRDAIGAISYALLFIVAYLWFRFELKFAVGAVVALAHDVLITVGVFSLAGRDITIPVVAALLTIIGYSLNDTIVVFDRIREDLKLQKGKGISYGDIINIGINRTLSRTLLTSLTTLFVVAVLYIFGGIAINDFAFALITGIFVGTYSSVFVASTVVFLWQNYRNRNIGGGGRRGEEQGGKQSKKNKKGSQDKAEASA